MTNQPAAVRLKQIRGEPLERGRAVIRLFERPEADERPHPRLRLGFAEVEDPAPPQLPATENWPDAAAFRKWLAAALADPRMRAGLDNPPQEDPRYWTNALRAQRITALLKYAEGAVAARAGWSATERDAAHYAIAELAALAYAGDVQFDDEDSGTYHSYMHDKPFVHVLERLRASLPREGSEAFALLPAEQQYAIRRQHQQITNHLDYLMRYKYAYAGITETDIERTLGGLLIDRETRQVVSEDPATRASLRPRYQLLRVDPNAAHPRAGAYLMRTAAGLALRDGTPVEVADALLRATEVPPARLTFERAPNDPRLRAGVRFDWNEDGWVDATPIPWLIWAGHCDAKAVLEQFGLALLGQPSLFEYRSDTGEVTELTRDLLLELLTAAVEFGSVHERLDGSGLIVRGIHRFGGARNDSLPDRLQFRGAGPGQHFRWPISREREAMQVTGLREADGEQVDLNVAFTSCIPDLDAVDFAANPRYLTTVEGDYNVIDATGMRVEATIRLASFDAAGELVREDRQIEIDLGPEAGGRTLLGTELHDAGERELYRVYLDREQPAIVAELWRWDRGRGEQVHVAERDVEIPLASPLAPTLSRETRLDDPALFQALLGLALQRGQNIVADTDAQAPVWNGVVTALQVERIAVNEQARVERWRVRIKARYGQSTLEYLVRRAADGAPLAYCPIALPGLRPLDFVWQDLPDIASKGLADGDWVVNLSMREREVIDVEWAPDQDSDWYVHDDHVKNAFELLYAALAGYRWTIVHLNKRYVFADEAAWKTARAKLDQLRGELEFE